MNLLLKVVRFFHDLQVKKKYIYIIYIIYIYIASLATHLYICLVHWYMRLMGQFSNTKNIISFNGGPYSFRETKKWPRICKINVIKLSIGY